ncbi:hypothetical protein EG329_011976 [Mollisiaceae sp. DMI_Dod_QoI]|nr:hypothetical protein EG329_011976 [Helotiales sp. DMI_Dod_QoI]
MDLLRWNTRVLSSGLSTCPSALATPGRSCLSVQCRRLSKQTHLLRRPNAQSIALPRKSRESASISRFFSTTQSERSVSQPSESTEGWKVRAGPDGPDLNLKYVKVGDSAWHPVFLRDVCTCPLCVNPSSKQRNFQTADIPADLEAKSVERKSNGDVAITWTKDIPGFRPDHVSTIPAEFFATYHNRAGIQAAQYLSQPYVWDKKAIMETFQFVDFQDYMNDDQKLWHALKTLHIFGILLLRGVPSNEHAMEDITSRIGHLRETFYGRTWDVKSIANAKNVAYTQQYLGLHMDLLYMHNPPGFQFLHCLKNTSPGGTSLFSDALKAAANLSDSNFNMLADQNIAFEYRNDGQHYYYERPVFEIGRHRYFSTNGFGIKQYRSKVLNVNWSPPFQAALPFQRSIQGYPLPKLLHALRKFAAQLQHPKAVYEYRLNEGECVIFNNRRILHGRTAFDTTQGERWLKGAYVDADVLHSRLRVLSEKFRGNVDVAPLFESAKYVHPEEAAARREELAARRKKAAEIENLDGQSV